MTTGDWFITALMTQYAVAAVVYAWGGQWWKALYWTGAFILTIPVLVALR